MLVAEEDPDVLSYREQLERAGITIEGLREIARRSGARIMRMPETGSIEITLLLDIASCAKEDSQFIIVTHSPILLGIPDAEILSFDSGEIHPIEYEDTDSYKITEMFINSREQILKRLLGQTK